MLWRIWLPYYNDTARRISCQTSHTFPPPNKPHSAGTHPFFNFVRPRIRVARPADEPTASNLSSRDNNRPMVPPSPRIDSTAVLCMDVPPGFFPRPPPRASGVCSPQLGRRWDGPRTAPVGSQFMQTRAFLKNRHTHTRAHNNSSGVTIYGGWPVAVPPSGHAVLRVTSPAPSAHFVHDTKFQDAREPRGGHRGCRPDPPPPHPSGG